MHGRSLAVVVAIGLILAVGCQDEVGSERSRPGEVDPAQIELPGADPLDQSRPSEDVLAQIKQLKDDDVNVRIAVVNSHPQKATESATEGMAYMRPSGESL